MNLGIDRLIADPALLAELEGRRVALLAHPASVTADLTHSLDALVAAGVNMSAVFGPQHGVRGDLQDIADAASSEVEKNRAIAAGLDQIAKDVGEVVGGNGAIASAADPASRAV